MRYLFILTLLVIGLAASAVQAEYLEITASEIASIEPADKSASPRVLVKWTLPPNLKDKIVDAAVIDMEVPISTGMNVVVDVAPVKTAWSASSVSWSSGWSKAGGDYDMDVSSPAILTARNDYQVVADVYELILAQIAGERTDNGFIVVPEASEDGKLATVSANNVTSLSKAKLIIAYRNRR